MIERIEITDGTKLISHRAREVSPVTFLIWVSTESAKYFKDCFCDFVIPLCHIGNCLTKAIEDFMTRIFVKELANQRRIWSSRLLRKETTLEDLLMPEVFKVLVQEARNPIVQGEWCIDCEPEPGSKLTSASMLSVIPKDKWSDIVNAINELDIYDYAMPGTSKSGCFYYELMKLSYALQGIITQDTYSPNFRKSIDTYASIPGIKVMAAGKDFTLESGLKRVAGYSKVMVYPSLGGDAVIAKMTPEQVKGGWEAIAKQILDWKKQYDWV